MTEKLSLHELQLMIRDSLYISFPAMYWVVGEISEIKENQSGHCYLELIEKQADDRNIRARVKAISWCKQYRFLKSYFENITGEKLKEGLKVLVRVKIEYHELYGLSLIICDIDPSFTIGEMAMKRQNIIRQLEAEGVFSMNKDLGLPYVIQKVAIISSPAAAGYTDFMNHLVNNEYGYVFYTCLFESPMQGPDTEQGILNAFEKISQNQEHFDAVVIIRGGGSQVDLSWFDNYNIAYYITQFPLPVLTGIGHDKDMSVSDMVASMALKTPTAVADFIVSHNALIENRLLQMMVEIKNRTLIIIEKNRKRLETSGIRLLPLSRILISAIKGQFSEYSMRMVRSGNEHIRKVDSMASGQASRLSGNVKSYFMSKRAFLDVSSRVLSPASLKLLHKRKSELDFYGKNLDLLMPENVLRRGYTITYLNGKIKKTREGLSEGNVIETKFIDGTISSKIIEDKD